MTIRFDNRVAVVTGAGAGLGREHALGLAARGAKVVVNDFGGGVDGSSGSSAPAEETVAMIKSAGGDAFAHGADVSNPEQVGDMVAKAIRDWGRIDILVNNAGITRDNLAMRMKDDEWADVIRINLEATFRLYRAAAKPMMKQRFGRMIAITSVVGVTGNPGQANYAASKAGLIGMSKALAQELASRNITVNCVAPGFIVSAMTDALPDAQKDALTGRIPAGRLGEGADIAAGVVYLASKEASYVTGHTLHINGGMAMP